MLSGRMDCRVKPGNDDVDCFASFAMTRTERTMSKSAFDKIKAALEEAKAYLDGSRDKRDFNVHTPKRKAKSA
jgi:hypothetical protein